MDFFIGHLIQTEHNKKVQGHAHPSTQSVYLYCNI